MQSFRWIHVCLVPTTKWDHLRRDYFVFDMIHSNGIFARVPYHELSGLRTSGIELLTIRIQIEKTEYPTLVSF